MSRSKKKVHKYSAEENAFIKAANSGVPIAFGKVGATKAALLQKEFNAKFGTSVTAEALVWKNRKLHGVMGSRKVRGRHEYTPDNDAFLLELMGQPNLSWKRRTQRLNRQFNVKLTQRSVEARGYVLRKQGAIPVKKAGLPNMSFFKTAVAGAPKTNGALIGYSVIVDGQSVWTGPERPEVSIREQRSVVSEVNIAAISYTG